MEKLSLNKHFLTVLFVTLSVLGGCNYTVDDFWKDLKSGEIETPLSQNTSSIATEFSAEQSEKHIAKYQITKALLSSPVVSVANARTAASGKSLNIIAAQKNLTANLSFNAGLYPDAGKPQTGAQATASLSKLSSSES